MSKKYNILICPLEWGLGHAGRMIPLAKKLQEKQNNVFVGAGKELQFFFRNELSGLTYVDFPGFKPRYSSFLPQYIALFLKTPILLYSIFSEHVRLKKIIDDYEIDIVISDNRFGLWNRKIKSVYITHQLLIPMPVWLRFLEWIGVLLHRFIIRHFTLCFIPDLPGELNLSGRLSHNVKLPENVRYIGILSRFSRVTSTEFRAQFPHNTLILSGPEPQRSILRQKLVDILNDSEQHTVILEGNPESSEDAIISGKIISYNHLPSNKMQEIIIQSSSIITRPGYTSVMELISLDCSALLIPTPGQTEQEYLAGYLSGKGWFTTVSQKELKAGLILPPRQSTGQDEMINESKKLLGKALDELLNQ